MAGYIQQTKHLSITDIVRLNMINENCIYFEEQGITPGTKVPVKTKSWWHGEEIETETYFFGVGIVYGDVTHIFHKIKKDGTMSQVNQYIGGRIISIHKI